MTKTGTCKLLIKASAKWEPDLMQNGTRLQEKYNKWDKSFIQSTPLRFTLTFIVHIQALHFVHNQYMNMEWVTV